MAISMRIPRRPLVATLAILTLASGAYLQAYVLSGHRWGTTSVLYYVNPHSIYVSPSAAVSAVQTAAAAWTEQSQAEIELVYAGATTGASLALNYKNEVFFRNGSNGSMVAQTYSWWDGNGRLIDSDIVFYEGAFSFFTGSGCSGGIYVENVGTHEFGHLLGLKHTSVEGATMAPSMASYCDRTQLTLESDDISGIETLYPPAVAVEPPAAPSQLTVAVNSSLPTSSMVLTWADNATNESGYRIERGTSLTSLAQVAEVGTNVRSYINTELSEGTTYYYRVSGYNNGGASGYSNTAAQTTATTTATNTAPQISVANPLHGASYPEGVAITFSGMASDGQEGDLTSGLIWTSNLAGALGVGGAFSKTLPAGNHVITASVSDSGGLNGSKQVNVTVTATAPEKSGITLTARGYKVKGLQKTDLEWSGFASTTLDVYRNGARISTTANDGAMTDPINRKGSGSYIYRVCAAGTDTCAGVTVTF